MIFFGHLDVVVCCRRNRHRRSSPRYRVLCSFHCHMVRVIDLRNDRHRRSSPRSRVISIERHAVLVVVSGHSGRRRDSPHEQLVNLHGSGESLVRILAVLRVGVERVKWYGGANIRCVWFHVHVLGFVGDLNVFFHEALPHSGCCFMWNHLTLRGICIDGCLLSVGFSFPSLFFFVFIHPHVCHLIAQRSDDRRNRD